MTAVLVPWQYPIRWPSLIHVTNDYERAAQLDWRDRELEDRLAQLAADIASGGGGGVPTTRLIATTLPLTGGGDLSADRTLAILSFAGSTPGAVPASPGGTTTFLRADGTWATPATGAPTPQPIDWLTDVTIAAVANGQVLIYDSASGQWKNTAPPWSLSIHTHFLDALADVNAPTPSDGQMLAWNAASSNWVAATPLTQATADGLYVNVGGDTMTGQLNMGNSQIKSVGAPTATTDATNKGYVDNLFDGRSWKQAVRLATTANLAALSGLAAIDGVTPAGNDRILVKDQTTTSQNGIYIAAAGTWTRAADADGSGELNGAVVLVREGTTNGDTAWMVTTDGNIVPPATNVWAKAFPAAVIAQPLDWLTDVTITAVATNHVLQYNGSQWVNVLALAGLTSVEATTHQAVSGTTMVVRAGGTAFVHLQGQGAFGSPTAELVVGASFGGGAPAGGAYCAVQAQNATNGWNTLPFSVNHSAGSGTTGIGFGNTQLGFGHGLLANSAGFHCRNINDTGYVSIAASAFPVNSSGEWKHNLRPIVGASFAVAAIDPVVYDDERPTLADPDIEMPTHVGFVAEDVDAVLPDITSGEGPDLAIDPMGLLAVLWQAVKELSGRLAVLEGAA